MKFQKFVFRGKDLTLVYICDIKFFSKEKIYQRLYINNENLLFLKFQHKMTGKLCGLGKNQRQCCVNDTIPLQNLLNF